MKRLRLKRFRYIKIHERCLSLFKNHIQNSLPAIRTRLPLPNSITLKLRQILVIVRIGYKKKKEKRNPLCSIQNPFKPTSIVSKFTQIIIIKFIYLESKNQVVSLLGYLIRYKLPTLLLLFYNFTLEVSNLYLIISETLFAQIKVY